MPDKVIASVYVYAEDRVRAYHVASTIAFALRENSEKPLYVEMTTAEQVMPSSCRVKVVIRAEESEDEDLPF